MHFLPYAGYEGWSYEAMNRKRDIIIALMMKYANDKDTYFFFAEGMGDDYKLNSEYTTDGLHLSTEGLKKLARSIFRFYEEHEL